MAMSILAQVRKGVKPVKDLGHIVMNSAKLKLFASRARKLTFWRLRLRIDRVFPSDFNQFLKQVSGVIHVGANAGGERDEYAKHGLRVIWIEPNPEIFKILDANIRGYPEQKALNCLITDQDDAEYPFHIASNDGLSSSILDLGLHREIWPDIDYKKTIKLRSTTLTTLLKKESINVREYPALVMDTQGSELLILKGAKDIIGAFQFLKIEVADFESYKGCCQLKEVDRFMKEHGFREVCRRKFAEHADGGSYFDIVYKREFISERP